MIIFRTESYTKPLCTLYTKPLCTLYTKPLCTFIHSACFLCPAINSCLFVVLVFAFFCVLISNSTPSDA